MENLACCVIRASFSQERMQYLDQDDTIPCIVESHGDEKTFRGNWARLIRKIGACPGEGRECLPAG